MAEGTTCPGNAGYESCCNCCPHCGCKLVPVCHVYWTTKKVTTYKYTCKCEYICVPGVTRLCDKCCDDDGCRDCKCRLHEVRRLVKIPCVKQVPVKKCTVEWVCPQCNYNGSGMENPPPSAPMPPTAAPLPPRLGDQIRQVVAADSGGSRRHHRRSQVS